MVNHFGSCEWVVWPTMRAIGVQPSSFAIDSRISTIAAAPSEIDEEVAAVTVPSLRKAGRSEGILSGLVLNGDSSRSTRTSPLRPAIFTGAISHWKLPSSLAVRARRADSIA